MPQPLCFDFGERYVSVRQWQVAFRVFTDENVYTPDPQRVQVLKTDRGLEVHADGFAWAGLQQRRDGRFVARIRWIDGGFDCEIQAALPDRIKGTTIYLRQVEPGQVNTPDFDFEDVPDAGCELTYPTRARMPVFMLRHRPGAYTVAMSVQSELARKTLVVLPQGDKCLVELHHHEDARRWSTEQRSPAWRIVATADPESLLKQRMRLNEQAWGLQPWETRPDVPDWARRLGLVLNLHGEHWTGFLFNDYARQLEIIRYVCERIDGRHVLAYLPAWDGRYNYNWPQYQANPRAGDEVGLQRLVHGAHELGVHVVPQIGAVSANRKYLPTGLHDAASHDAFGNTYVKLPDWDGDRQPDTYRVNANIGHPGFRQFLFDATRRMVDAFGFDGIFLDINQDHHNDPRFSITDGHREFARACHETYQDFLVFGEHWYDALLGSYPLVHSVTSPSAGVLRNWRQAFDRYARTTYHLIHPAPSGSTGVYEDGYRPPFVPDPELNAIPAIAFVHDTLEQYADGVDQRIAAARAYMKRTGIG